MKTVKHYSVEAMVTKEMVEVLNREIPFTVEDLTELGMGVNIYLNRQELTYAINEDWDMNKSLDFIVKLENKIVKTLEKMYN